MAEPLSPTPSLPAPLWLLPERAGGAAWNMACDLALLEQPPAGLAGAALLRPYRWAEPSATLGVMQPWAWAAAQASALGTVAVRRPTAGGWVDHRADWTYALVLPPGLVAQFATTTAIYEKVHQVLAACLVAQGVPATLLPCPRACATSPAALTANAEVSPTAGAMAPSACFVEPSPYDVMDAQRGGKIAGAALKRTRQGVLWQGSLSRAAVAPYGWSGEGLAEAFALALAQAWGLPGVERLATVPEPPAALVAQFASPAWNQRR